MSGLVNDLPGVIKIEWYLVYLMFIKLLHSVVQFIHECHANRSTSYVLCYNFIVFLVLYNEIKNEQIYGNRKFKYQ